MSVSAVGGSQAQTRPAPVERREAPRPEHTSREEHARRTDEQAATVELRHSRPAPRAEQVEHTRAHDEHHARAVQQAYAERRVDVRV